MSDEPGGYQTYLLRLWSVQIQGKRQLRASIENPHTGERQSFNSLEQCFTFLQELNIQTRSNNSIGPKEGEKDE